MIIIYPFFYFSYTNIVNCRISCYVAKFCTSCTIQYSNNHALKKRTCLDENASWFFFWKPQYYIKPSRETLIFCMMFLSKLKSGTSELLLVKSNGPRFNKLSINNSCNILLLLLLISSSIILLFFFYLSLLFSCLILFICILLLLLLLIIKSF